METKPHRFRKISVIILVLNFLFVISMVSAQTGTWIYNGDGTATNVTTGQRVIIGSDRKAGTNDDNQIVNPAGTVLLKDVKLSIDPSSTVYVELGKGFNLYGGADGWIGTTDDVIKGFGRYVRSDVTGAAAEPLSWRLLDIDGDQATLICDAIIDGIQFNLNAGDGNDWSKSNLRTWLNSKGGQNSSGNITGFYNTAFNETEKAKIVLTEVSMNSNTTFIAYNRLLKSDRWKYYKTTGTDTQDYVWTLSGEEIFKYFGRSKIAAQKELGHDPENYTNAYCRPTYYAIAKGVKTNSGGNGASFIGFGDVWTRSPGAPTDGGNYYGIFLGETGSLNSGRIVNTLYGALPVVKVNLGK